jgi:hypothetical protein
LHFPAAIFSTPLERTNLFHELITQSQWEFKDTHNVNGQGLDDRFNQPTCNFHNGVGAHPLSHHLVCSVIRAGKKNTLALILKHWGMDFGALQHES